MSNRHGADALVVMLLSNAYSLVARVAEHDAGAARGPQFRTQRVGVGAGFFRDADDERRARPAARVHDQRQPVAQDGSISAAQPLIGGEDTAFGPVAGKLDTPRPPGGAGAERQPAAHALHHRLGDLDAA